MGFVVMGNFILYLYLYEIYFDMYFIRYRGGCWGLVVGFWDKIIFKYDINMEKNVVDFYNEVKYVIFILMIKLIMKKMNC